MVNTFLLNGLNTILAIYLLIIFFWWWIKLKEATNFYKITSFLMLGLAIQYGVLTLCNFESIFLVRDYDQIVSAWYIFPAKIVATSSLFFYAFYISKRLIRNKTLGKISKEFVKPYNIQDCPHKDICNIFPICAGAALKE